MFHVKRSDITPTLLRHRSDNYLLYSKKVVPLHHGHKEMEVDYQTDNRSVKRNSGRAW